MLFEYMKQVQRLIHDSKMQLVDPQDLIYYINLAREEVAMRSQCLRLLTPISGSIIGATVTAEGSGYTNPTATITPPDFPNGQAPYPAGLQAIATVQQVAGKIVNIDVPNGGSGYFMPVLTINDPTGSGAAGTLNLSLFNQTQGSQEVYPFSGVDLTPFPGYGSIIGIRSVSIIYSNYRYSLPMYPFTVYQAFIRQFPYQYSYVPTMCSILGQGAAGTLYTYPLPSQQYQMEWDSICLPAPLEDDGSPEAIPLPWTRAVQHYAAKYAFEELQNFNSARYHEEMFNRMLPRYRGAVDPGRNPNPYGRFLIPLAMGVTAASALAHLLPGIFL